MKDIGIVISVICVSSVACSVVSCIAPQNGSKRILSMVLGVFIVCALIVPIKNAVSGFSLNIDDIKLNQSEIATADEILEKNVISEAERRLEKVLGVLLRENDIKFKGCKINLKSDKDTGINIDSIRIYLYKTEDVMKAERIVKSKFEVSPEIYRCKNENQ